jgi:hypothetical protein
MKSFAGLLAPLALVALGSCIVEDPGSLQSGSREFEVEGFNSLSVTEAMIITVTRGAEFSVRASGDIRNLDDLKVSKNGNVLEIQYANNRSRRHETVFEVTMPELTDIDLSAATAGTLVGFDSGADMTATLSGASSLSGQIQAGKFSAVALGASRFRMSGNAGQLNADLSGASAFDGLLFYTNSATAVVSGASTLKINVNQSLEVTVTGASSVIYRGSPLVQANVSGGSTLVHDQP